MTDERRLRDIVQMGTVAECAENFRRMVETCRSANKWIEENCERNDRRITLSNLLEASAGYLCLAGENVGKHISVAALCTRSLYEINLQTRDVLKSDQNLSRWMGEVITDKIQVLEGILKLNAATTQGRTAAQSEIARLKSLRKKYDLPEAKPSAAVKLAESLGLANEHEGLFKLFSKLVHPTSYLINDQTAASEENGMILQVYAQLYAGDTFSRICDAFSVPEAIRTISPPSTSHTQH